MLSSQAQVTNNDFDKSFHVNIDVKPLIQSDYEVFGDVIGVRPDVSSFDAYMGTAKKFNNLSMLENLRPGSAEPNLSFFQCNPQVCAPQSYFKAHILERHPFSTQAFIPMHGAERFLVLVCLGKDVPDLKTAKAFLASGAQGITYKPGVWHHPLIAMDQVSNFACLVWENETSGDCHVHNLEQPLMLKL